MENSEYSDGEGAIKRLMERISPVTSDIESLMDFDDLMQQCKELLASEAEKERPKSCVESIFSSVKALGPLGENAPKSVMSSDEEPDTQMQFKICCAMKFNDCWKIDEIDGNNKNNDDVSTDELIRRAEELIESNSKDDDESRTAIIDIGRKVLTVRPSSMPCYNLRSLSRNELFFSQAVDAENIPPVENKSVDENCTDIECSQGRVQLRNRERKTRPRGVYVPSDELDTLNENAKIKEGNKQPMNTSGLGRVLRSNNSSKRNRFLNAENFGKFFGKTKQPNALATDVVVDAGKPVKEKTKSSWNNFDLLKSPPKSRDPYHIEAVTSSSSLNEVPASEKPDEVSPVSQKPDEISPVSQKPDEVPASQKQNEVRANEKQSEVPVSEKPDEDAFVPTSQKPDEISPVSQKPDEVPASEEQSEVPAGSEKRDEFRAVSQKPDEVAPASGKRDEIPTASEKRDEIPTASGKRDEGCVKRRSIFHEDAQVKRKSARFEIDGNAVQLIPSGKRITVLENLQIYPPSVALNPTIGNAQHIEIVETNDETEYDIDERLSEEVTVRLEITPIRSAVDIVHSPTISESTSLSHIATVPEINVSNGNEERDDEYNDLDPLQNELIGMEQCGSLQNVGENVNSSLSMDLFKKMALDCQNFKLHAPLSFKELAEKDWQYAYKYADRNLVDGHKFIKVDELNRIPRRHGKFPFCHPGPMFDEESDSDDWYYADSIVKLKGNHQTYYVVRWLGYEDDFNTLQTEESIGHTAILILHKRKRYGTACKSNGPVLLRRSVRQTNNPVMIRRVPTSTNAVYLMTMKLLDEHLDLERKADRYSLEIGFHSIDGEASTALQYQCNFVKKVFIPIIERLKSPGFHMSRTYFGTPLGNILPNKALGIDISITNDKDSIRTYIYNRLKAATGTATTQQRYASFFVISKHSKTEVASTKHLDMHMCVYTVRSCDNKKDCVYFDPSPECYRHPIPQFIRDLRAPKMLSSTRTFGKGSSMEDCFYQCLKYVVGLHTGEVSFVANSSSKYFH